MKYFLIFAFNTLAFLNIDCQIVNYKGICDSIDFSRFESPLTGELLQVTDLTIGSQFYYDWDSADITMNSGEVIHNKLLRYNGYINELIWQTPIDYKLVKLDKSDIKEVYFKKLHSLFRQLKIKEQNDTLVIFAEVLFEHKVIFYAYRKFKRTHSEISTNAGTSFSRDLIKNDTRYFLKLPDNNNLYSFSNLKRRNLLSAFPLYGIEIKKILRQSHISVNSEKDFVEALKVIVKSLY